MLGLMKNEVWLWLQKRNIIVFFMAVFVLVGTFFFHYVSVYQSSIQNKIDVYQNAASENAFRIQMYEENQKALEKANLDTKENEKLLAFWREDQLLCQSLSSNWRMHDKEKIAQDLYARDQHTWDTIQSGVDLSMYPSILQNTKSDLQNRLLLEEQYIKEHNYDFIYENKPTGAYLLSQMFQEGSVIIFVFAICILLWNYDIWSHEFEDGSYRLLFTLPFSKRRIYAVRSLTSLLCSLLGCFLLTGIWFSIGSCFYGTGLNTLIAIKSSIISIGSYCVNLVILLLFYLLFLQMFIQFLSLLTKNSGHSLIIPLLLFLFLYMNAEADLFNPFSYMFAQVLLIDKGSMIFFPCCGLLFAGGALFYGIGSFYVKYQEI